MHDQPDLPALELLVAVEDEGSLGAAARRVGLAQPNASRTLARLERRCGVPLVVRRSGGSTLTAEGALVAGWARPVLAEAARLTTALASLRTGDVQPLRIAASQTVAEHLAPAWLVELRSRLPDQPVAMAVTNSTAVVDQVRAGAVALGFVEGPVVPGDLHQVVVGSDELVVVVGREHPWARRTDPLTARELSMVPLITRERGSGTREALEVALRPHRSTDAALALSSNAAVRAGAEAGAAPAVLGRLAVAEALAAGRLVAVPTTGMTLGRPLRAVWSGPRRLDGAAGELVRVARAGTASVGSPAAVSPRGREL